MTLQQYCGYSLLGAMIPLGILLTVYFCVKLGTYAYLSAVRKFYLKHPKEFANGETRSRASEDRV